MNTNLTYRSVTLFADSRNVSSFIAGMEFQAETNPSSWFRGLFKSPLAPVQVDLINWTVSFVRKPNKWLVVCTPKPTPPSPPKRPRRTLQAQA